MWYPRARSQRPIGAAKPVRFRRSPATVTAANPGGASPVAGTDGALEPSRERVGDDASDRLIPQACGTLPCGTLPCGALPCGAPPRDALSRGR